MRMRRGGGGEAGRRGKVRQCRAGMFGGRCQVRGVRFTVEVARPPVTGDGRPVRSVRCPVPRATCPFPGARCHVPVSRCLVRYVLHSLRVAGDWCEGGGLASRRRSPTGGGMVSR
jgi:hypothetical protein